MCGVSLVVSAPERELTPPMRRIGSDLSQLSLPPTCPNRLAQSAQSERQPHVRTRSSQAWLAHSGIWGSRGREFKSRQPDAFGLVGVMFGQPSKHRGCWPGQDSFKTPAIKSRFETLGSGPNSVLRLQQIGGVVDLHRVTQQSGSIYRWHALSVHNSSERVANQMEMDRPNPSNRAVVGRLQAPGRSRCTAAPCRSRSAA
jgi:hypothetical protein